MPDVTERNSLKSQTAIKRKPANKGQSCAIALGLVLLAFCSPLGVAGAMLLSNPAAAQESANILARKGNAQLIRKENDKAILTLSEALSIGNLPLFTKASILNDRALAYARIKKFERALDDFNQAIETFPEFATAYNNRGLLLHGLGHYQEAIKDFNRAIALQPKLGASFHNRANAYLKSGAEGAAFRDFGQAIQLLNNRAPSHLARGQIHRTHDRNYAALRELNQALAQSENFSETFYNRAEVFQSLGENKAAIEDYRRAVQIADENVTYKMALAVLLLEEGQTRDAQKLLSQIITLEPLNAKAMIMRGRILGERGAYTKALDDLDQAVSLTDSAAAFAERALVRARHKMPEEAIEDMDQAIQKAPGTSRQWAILGEAAMLVQLPSNAERYYLESLKRDKDNKAALAGLIELGLREPQEEIIPLEPENPTWVISEVEKGKFVATHAAFGDLTVHLDIYGPNPPEILEWTELNGKYKGFGLLRYDAGSKNRKQPYEQVSIINLKQQKVLSIEPYRWGKKIAKWEWGDYDLKVEDPDGIESRIALAAPPVKRRQRKGVEQDDWLFGNDGFWISNPKDKPKKKRKVRVKKKKKKKSIFGIFGF